MSAAAVANRPTAPTQRVSTPPRTGSTGGAENVSATQTDRFTPSTQSDLGLYKPGMFGGDAMGTNIRSDYNEDIKTRGGDRLNPESRSSRLADLDGVSQLDSNRMTIDDENRCGPSTVVAGMYYADGSKGIQNLMTDMQAYSDRHGLDYNPYAGSDGLRERVRSGDLSKGDLNQIQDNLYGMMQMRQDEAIQDNGGNIVQTGIGDRVINEFINDSPNVKKTFDDNGMAIAVVDTDGQNGGNHFVLAGQHEGRPFVYDPWSIEGDNGQLNQVTQNRDELIAYRDAITPVNGNDKYVYSASNVPYN